MSSTHPVAVLCGDLHFSHRRPSIWSESVDWLEVQARYIKQLCDVADREDVPIVCSGDVFDRWNAPPEIINYIATCFGERHIYAIPGQHDLPHHRLEDIKRSAYWSLVKMGTIKPIGRWPKFTTFPGIRLFGFPWGTIQNFQKKRHPLKRSNKRLDLAVIHAYAHTPTTGHPEANDDSLVRKWRGRLGTKFQVAHFGDNHNQFTQASAGTRFVNCGCFIRRSKNELDTKPAAALLYMDGTVIWEPYELDKDIFVETSVEVEERDLSQFVTGLKSLVSDAVDFGQAVREALNDESVTEAVRILAWKALENGYTP